MTIEFDAGDTVRAYSIMMDRSRVKDFYGREELTLKGQAGLVESISNKVPGYGVESVAHSSFSIKEQDFHFPDNETRGKHICGQVFKREEKESPADLSLAFQIKGVTRSAYYNTFNLVADGEEKLLKDANFWIDLLVVGDGATMLVDKGDWPSEVKEICGDIPDVLWRTCVEHVCGNQQAKSPFNQLVEEKMGATREDCRRKIEEYVKSKFEVYTEPKDLSLAVWDYINSELEIVYKKIFKGFSQDDSNKYPSGVLGALAVRGVELGFTPNKRVAKHQEEFLSVRGFGGFTVCGDITITAGDGILLNDPDVVNNHDDLLNKIGGRKNNGVKLGVSSIRKDLVGNLPNPNASKISKNIDSGSRNILMFTDGMRLSYQKSPWARYPWDLISEYSNGRDFSATVILQDPELAILSKRRQNRVTGVRGDDGAYGYWAKWQVLQNMAPNKN